MILGSPFNESQPSDGFGRTLGNFTYPTGPQGRAAFGDFIVEALRYFNPDAGCNLIDALEVWNEPNGPTATSPYRMDAVYFVNLCQSAAAAVYNANQAGMFTTAKRVVSGGVYMNGQWEPYFDQIVQGAKALCTYQLGIHPYYFYVQKPPNTVQYVSKAVSETMARYDSARSRMLSQGVGNELWVTEVATTSQSPWGYTGQNDAMKQIIDTMKSRANLGAFIVHRLFYDGFVDPPGSLLYQCNVCDGPAPNASVKTVYGGIQSRWAGW